MSQQMRLVFEKQQLLVQREVNNCLFKIPHIAWNDSGNARIPHIA